MSYIYLQVLAAECQALEKMLAEVPACAIIDRMSLESRLRSVQEEMKEAVNAVCQITQSIPPPPPTTMSNENTAIQTNCCGKCSELRLTWNGFMCLFMTEAIFLGEAFRKPACERFDPVDARQSRKDDELPEPELSLCPHCGGKVQYIRAAKSNGIRTDWICCPDCHFYTDMRFFRNEREFLEAWNLRVPAAPQWTTEPPNASGMYLAYIPMCGLYTHDIYFDGAGTGHIGKGTLAEFVKDNTNVLWCTVHVPPLPEGKESDE